MNSMQAARLHAIGDFRADRIPIPQVHGEELLLKVGACGICGSDIPRIFDHGTSNQVYPMVIGHEFAGTVVAVGEDADPSLIGRQGAVFPLIPCRHCGMCQVGKYAMCSHYDYLGSRRDGGFAEYVVIPSQWNFIPSENPDTPMEALAMTEPVCVAQHAIRQSGLTAGERIVIFGAGTIGLLAARWAEIFGAGEILLVDVDDRKVRFAEERGFHAINSHTCDPAEELRKRSAGGADVAIEGTGFGSALEGCIDAVRPEGRIVMLGNPGQSQTAIDRRCHSGILRKELRIVGSWNSNYAPYPFNEWQYTVSMMDKGILKVSDLITHRVSIGALPAFCEKLRSREISACKAVCVPGE